jgi:hypothetical protein
MKKTKAGLTTEVIDTLLKKYKSDEELSRQLSNGFIPEELRSEFRALYDKQATPSMEIGTDLELAQYSNWFYQKEGKILGVEKSGSGFINPVITKGKITDLSKIPYSVPMNSDFSAPEDGDVVEVKAEVEEPELEASKTIDLGTVEVTSQNEPSSKEEALNSLISQRVSEFGNKKDGPSKPDIITIDESLKLYNKDISEAEIKAWVYFKRLHGNPMFGYEKYYLSTKAEKSKLVIAEQSLDLLDQSFRKVKMVPSGTIIGVKTKFKNEYDNETYLVVKNDQNELYYVPSSKVKEEDSLVGQDIAELDQLVKDKGICYSNGEYVPVPFYTYGNIYDIKEALIGKYNAETEQHEGGEYDELVSRFGTEIADWHKELIDHAIKLKGEFSFAHPEKSKRPFLSKENDISNEFKIRETNESSGLSFAKIFEENKTRRDRWKKYDEETSYSLFEAFTFWFKDTVNDTMLNNTTKSDVTRFYINNQNFAPKTGEELTEKEKEAIKLNAKIEGENWYQEFLAICLTYTDMVKLNYLFNKRYNSFSKINISKIPVAFEANRHVFSREDFMLKPVQRDGLAFISANNSGCYAYDVGFGKTLCAIHTLASVLKEGKVKRPLIAIPKPVYNNWVREMFGFWTDGQEKRFEEFPGAQFVKGALTGTKYKLQLWYNLSKAVEFENKLVEPYTLTLVSYQGLEKIGYSTKLREEMANDLNSIIGKQSVAASGDERKKAQEYQDVLSKIGLAESETEIDVDTCGFDYLVIDEAHNFKNVFGSVKLEKEQNDIWKIPNKPSTKRALKAFVICLYLQKRYNGNVLLLTATPFTNSPLEIFSMMALIGYQNLKKYGIDNIHTFLAMFIETTSEFTVDAMNNIKIDTVIKSFKNKNLLRDILYRHFDYQDNPIIAGIKRPCKINYPNKQVNTYLEMSATQMVAQEIVREQAASYSKENPGAMGRALNWAKNNAFSPFLVPGIPTYENVQELVNESPKIKFAIECIKSVKEYHEGKGQEMSGMVVYSNRGKALFEDIKTAMNEICGFKKKIAFGDEFVDEVELLTSAGSEKEMDRKEVIKDAFNKGYVKVVIGTSTIKEGVNLQERGTVEFNLDLDWNPTDFKQLEGRIWRQGNKFRYVRVTVPLVQNTLDSFINQKLDEKGKRIASIWDKTNDVNYIEEDNYVDPMEIKFALIDNANDLVGMKYSMESKGFKKQFDMANEKYQGIFSVEVAIGEFDKLKNNQEESFRDTYTKHKLYLSYLKRFSHERAEYLDAKDKKQIESLEVKLQENIELLEMYLEKGDMPALFKVEKNLKNRNHNFRIGESNYDYHSLLKKYDPDNYDWSLSSFSSWDFPKLVFKYGEIKKYERMSLSAYGLSLNDDLSVIKNKFKQELDEAQAALDFLETPEYKEKTMLDVLAELQKRAEQRGTIEDRVAGFAATNYLLSYPFVEELADSCVIPTTEFNGDFNVAEYDVHEEYQEAVVDNIPVTPKQFTDIKQTVKYKKTKEKEAESITPLSAEAKLFVPKFQEKIIRTNVEFEDARVRVNEVVANMPKTYETDGIPTKDKIAQLHYFYGNSDWYIFEKDSEEDQLQAFGAVRMGYPEYEFGYVNIQEIVSGSKVELDLYFTPTKWSVITGDVEQTEDQLPADKVDEIAETSAAIEMLYELAEMQKGKEKKETLQAIEMLTELRDSMNI